MFLGNVNVCILINVASYPRRTGPSAI